MKRLDGPPTAARSLDALGHESVPWGFSFSCCGRHEAFGYHDRCPASYKYENLSPMKKKPSYRAMALQSRDAIDLLSNKWRVALLHLLTPGPLRAGEIQRAVEEVSPKMLTQTLRGLERDGLIHRHIRNVVPAHVEYELTMMGESIIPLLRELCHWAKANARTRDDSRRRFDQGDSRLKSLRGRVSK